MKTLIALCGAPGSGKSEVQRYLEDNYLVEPVDDGACIRDFAMRHLGLTKWHVTTQAGKASMVSLPGGRTELVRVVLGEIGNKIEELFGPDAIPEMALMKLPCGDGAFSFGSVRRKQGHVYKRAGGLVIEIVRPGYECVNEFDQYDRSCVDLTINNDKDVATLCHRVDFHLGKRLRALMPPQ